MTRLAADGTFVGPAADVQSGVGDIFALRDFLLVLFLPLAQSLLLISSTTLALFAGLFADDDEEDDDDDDEDDENREEGDAHASSLSSPPRRSRVHGTLAPIAEPPCRFLLLPALAAASSFEQPSGFRFSTSSIPFTTTAAS